MTRWLLAWLVVSPILLAPSVGLFASRCYGQAIEQAATAETKPRLTVATTRFGVVNLMDLNLDGTKATQRTFDTVGIDEPAWSADGSQLAYVSYKTGRRQIYVLPSDGSDERQLTHSSREARNPGWTADGKRLVFADDRGGVQDIFAVDIDGKNEVNLTCTRARMPIRPGRPTENRLCLVLIEHPTGFSVCS
jgi:dipeptidyl aminopeptidase/acylaminoacyl peptidase